MAQEYVKALIKNSIMDRKFECSSVSSQSSNVSNDEDFGTHSSLQNATARSPSGSTRGRSVKEFEEQLTNLKKENFNLKLRIYFLEERMGTNFDLDKESVIKKNVELMVEIENYKKELQEKHDLLCQAVKAMELEDEEHKKVAQDKEEQLMQYQQEIEDLRVQLQELKYEPDGSSSHRSFGSDPAAYYSKQTFNLQDPQNIIKELQEKVNQLEDELTQEKQHNASIQIILDQAENLKCRFDLLQKETAAKDEKISSLTEEVQLLREKLSIYQNEIKDLEARCEESNCLNENLSEKLQQKNKILDEMLSQINDLRRKCTNSKIDLEREHKRMERMKMMSDLKVTELEDENDKQKAKIRDLQGKLEAAMMEVKKNQNLAVSNSPVHRLSASNTDVPSFSVTNSATSVGAAQKDTLPIPLESPQSSQSSVPSSPDVLFNVDFEKILEGGDDSLSKKLIEQLRVLKKEYEYQKQKIIKLKAEQMKACKIIKGMIDSRNKCHIENGDLKKQVEKLEEELRSVECKQEKVIEKLAGSASDLQAKVSEVNITAANPTENEKTMAECQGDGVELMEHYKAFADELEEKIQILMATMQEKDFQLASLKQQYDEVLQNLQERDDKIVDLEFELLSLSEHKNSARRTLFSEKTDLESEKDESFYIKQLEERDHEVERLNVEINKLNCDVRKRTGDLQGLVNKELWEKNRHIEKLENRYAIVLENKEKELLELKNDLSSKDLQLRILKDRISELGIETRSAKSSQLENSSNDSLSSENLKALKEQLKHALEERKHFEEKIKEMRQVSQSTDNEKVVFIEKLREDIGHLQREYEHSEKLRIETNEICSVLSARLEELAIFLDSLLKQKSILGFLGSKRNRLREVINQSLDLSRTFKFNLSILSDPEQSLLQLSNLTNMLNMTDAGKDSLIPDKLEDDNTCLSIVPDNITLTYHSHLYASTATNNPEDDSPSSSQIIETLRKQIENLKCELQLRDNELVKLNDLLYKQKCTENDSPGFKNDKRELQGIGDIKEDMIGEQSPNKTLNTSTTLKYRSDNQSESEAWSEPDRNVSKARIGLESNARASVGKRSKLTCKVSSESTEDECSRSLNKTPSKKNCTENRQTIVELHKQLCELEEKLLEKDKRVIVLEENNLEINNLLKEEKQNYNKLKTELSNFELLFKETEEKLQIAEKQKAEAEEKIRNLERVVDKLKSEKEKLETYIEVQSKDVQNHINLLEVEKNQALKTVKEAERELENANNELKQNENKLFELRERMNNMENSLREEYQEHVISKLKCAEEEFIRQLKSTEEKAHIEIYQLQEKIQKVEDEYNQAYIEKCKNDEKVFKLDRLVKENELLKAAASENEQNIKILKNREQEFKEKLLEYQDRINLLRRDLDNATLQYSEAILDKTKIANEKSLLEEEMSKVNQKETEMKKQIADIQKELMSVKQNYHKQLTLLQDQKSKLEVRISELESANAELHNRLISLRTAPGDHVYSSSLPTTTTNSLYDLGHRNIPVNQLVNYKRQCSDNSGFTSEEQIGDVREGGFIYPLRLQANLPADVERHEANSSPDLGIESDHGRFSSLEAQLNIPRPLLQTLELTESMHNLLDNENNLVESVDCGNEHCCKKSLQMAHENSDLKKKLLRTRRALEETVTQLTLANQRKKQVEKTICKQIHKTSQVLRKAKANLDSGSETDVNKK